MTIRLTFQPDDLMRAVGCVEKFRAADDTRPILEAVHVRFEKGSKRARVEFTATDSYHLIRVSTPIATRLPFRYDDPNGSLVDGILIRLPLAELARFDRAARRAEQARLRAETRAIDDAQRKARIAKSYNDGRPVPEIPERGEPLRYQVVVSEQQSGQFGMSTAGAWNGRGVFVTAVGAAADKVGAIATGGRVGGDYPDVDSLLGKATAAGLNVTEPVAFNGLYLADICVAADRFAARYEHTRTQAPLRLMTAGGPNSPFVFDVKVPDGDGCRFTAIAMPVRVN